MPDFRYYSNEHSGELHRVILLEGREFKREQCNLDDAILHGHLREIEEEEALRRAAMDAPRLCGHCWFVQTEVT